MMLHPTWFFITGIIIYVLLGICCIGLILLIIGIIKIKKNKTENSKKWGKRLVWFFPISLIVLIAFCKISSLLGAFDREKNHEIGWGGDREFIEKRWHLADDEEYFNANKSEEERFGEYVRNMADDIE